MVFSTYTFIFIFLPLTFFTYSLLLARGYITVAKSSLVVASLIFYAYGAGDFFPFFVASVLINYFIGRHLGSERSQACRKRKRLILGIGLVLNLLLLGYYKYTDFVIFNINWLFEAEIPYQNILLPIGISFFTFQLIAYIVDAYQGKTKEYSFLNYMLFITFFPPLLVGPIVHHKDVVPQYSLIRQRWLDYDNIAKGLFLFSIGCAKKLLLADPMTDMAQNSFDEAQSLNSVEAWTASMLYTLSYYFDLSGYADMAIGLGLMFGILLPMNFNSPYKARNFADYWRRWHMTLSRFLGDYIFRNIYKKGMGSKMFYFAVFITFLVSGFWHGAGWTFVVWGIINGIFVIFAHMMTRAGCSLPLLLAWGLTMLGIIGTRVLFVADSFEDAWHVLVQMFTFSTFSLDGNNIALKAPAYIFIGMFIVLVFKNSHEIMEKYQTNFKYAFFTAVLITLSLLNMGEVKGFLYFQF